LIGAVVEIVGGKEGGCPSFAQVGGKLPEKLVEALVVVNGIVKGLVS
jgi:alanyl-tRNA synthetase